MISIVLPMDGTPSIIELILIFFKVFTSEVLTSQKYTER